MGHPNLYGTVFVCRTLYVHLPNAQTLVYVLGNLAPDPPKISSSASQPDLLGGWDSWADSPTLSSAAPTQPKKSTFEGRHTAVMYILLLNKRM